MTSNIFVHRDLADKTADKVWFVIFIRADKFRQMIRRAIVLTPDLTGFSLRLARMTSPKNFFRDVAAYIIVRPQSCEL